MYIKHKDKNANYNFIVLFILKCFKFNNISK